MLRLFRKTKGNNILDKGGAKEEEE